MFERISSPYTYSLGLDTDGSQTDGQRGEMRLQHYMATLQKEEPKTGLSIMGSPTTISFIWSISIPKTKITKTFYMKVKLTAEMPERRQGDGFVVIQDIKLFEILTFSL